MRDRELARKKRPDDVDVEDVAEVIRRHILCRRLDRADHTGGVDEDVETTETLDGGAEHRTDVVLLRHVAGCDEGFSLRVLIVEPHGMAFEGLRIATGQDEVRAVTCEHVRDRAAEALRRARDDSNLFDQRRIHVRAPGALALHGHTSSGTSSPSGIASSTAASRRRSRWSITSSGESRALGPARPRAATGPPYSSRSGTATPQTPTFVSSNEIAQPLFRISARFSRSSSGSVIVARQSRSSEPVATRPTSSSARKASSASCEAPACRGRRRAGSTERRSGC